ncbi:gamma-soluble NSF attachment protein [Lepeophtheirus salmonis]|uniref:Gamma-soluble NSF attachment protein n=1 Tax=Lepeophtheirus salmonis TaxID=72036 RepID=D3PGH5_LEPSM|nr:gamma-soluble NSF attachment protein-like [Lepeophtheirus salmonis]ADD24371.1 Gamma-soluble NSF attachment protein [Lepeophtheirus salmonis]
MEAKKRAEALEHIRKAEKALKTSLLKWTPDYDSAADEYSRAATAFKVAKEPKEALNALDRACECYKEIRSLYQAAKMLELSVLICRDLGQTDSITKLAERGSHLYRLHGSPESASQLLEKSAKILEDHNEFDEALALYEKAAETVIVEDRPKIAAEYMTKVARLKVKTENYSGAVESCTRTLELFQESSFTNTAGGVVAGAILCHLMMEDGVAAAKFWAQWGGYCDSDIGSTLQRILRGYNDEEDAELVKEGLNSPVIRQLDVEFALMARKIKVPEGIGAAAEAVARINKEKIAKSEASQEEQEKDEGFEHSKEESDEDELC